MERMINNRLVWYLETNNYISKYQCGFRKQRSTTDHLVRLETFVRESFINRQHLVAVFFDLEKAYDTTWKHGIMRDLHDAELRGRLPIFIGNFLADRQFQVRIGATLSDTHRQEMGVPQGSILSVTLFNLKINSIVKCLLPGVECCLYVDDFLICIRSMNMNVIERRLQQVLNRLHSWTLENGFKFSRSKTVCMHFCQQRKMHNDPQLFLDGTPLPVVQEFKYLGVIFDNKLSFIPHLRYLRGKCLRALNLLKVVAHNRWGGDREMLLMLYRSLIRSKLDYGSIVYGSARKSYLQMLDPIHNQGLRLCLGAFRTSPVASLYAEANEPSLNDRRDKLALQYIFKVKSNKDNPAYDSIFRPQHAHLFEAKPNAIRPLGMRMQPFMDAIPMDINRIDQLRMPQVPPWQRAACAIDYSILIGKKEDVHPVIYQAAFNKLKMQHLGAEYIYTDGSKEGNKVGAAAVTFKSTYKERLPDHCSVFSAELVAILLALQHVQSSSANRWVIVTDSKSALQAIEGQKWQNPLIRNILDVYENLHERNDIVFCWVPSHVGIKGNELADRHAKLALTLPPGNRHIPFTDSRCGIRQFIMNRWQATWQNATSNKLRQIKPSVSEVTPSYGTVRKEEVVLCRARIGHTYLTHCHLLKGEPAPECEHCHSPLTVKHILLECNHYTVTRNQYYTVDSLNSLFNQVEAASILQFLKDIGMYDKF